MTTGCGEELVAPGTVDCYCCDFSDGGYYREGVEVVLGVVDLTHGYSRPSAKKMPEYSPD